MDESAFTPLSRAATAVLEATIGALPVPAYTSDLRGCVTWQNAASRAVAGDLRGEHYSKTVPPTEQARARETFAAVTLAGVSRRRTGLFRSATGELVELEVITAPMRSDGQIVGTFGIAIPSVPATTSRAAEQLSPRQLDVLRLLVQGRTTMQIADELHLAPDTVRNHLRRLFTALGARTRLEAVLIALRQGLVELNLE